MRTKLLQRSGEVMLMCKAYNGRVVMHWLAERVAGVAEQHRDPGAGDERLCVNALCMCFA